MIDSKLTESTKYAVQQGRETHVLNVVRCESGSLVYQMWIEYNGKKINSTWTTRQRLDKETKKYFGI
jgi:hypothetical protein